MGADIASVRDRDSCKGQVASTYHSHFEQLHALPHKVWTRVLAELLREAESNDNGYNELGAFASQFIGRFSVQRLAADLNVLSKASACQSYSNSRVVRLIDLLGGARNDAFPFQHVASLLTAFDVDWSSWDGEDFGELLCVLSLWPECQKDPAQAGRVLSPLLQHAHAVLEPSFIAQAVRYVWDDGWSSDMVGPVLAELLPASWREANLSALVLSLVRCLTDGEELDMMDYDYVDSSGHSGDSNPAVRIGKLVDLIGLPANKGFDFAVQTVLSFRQHFHSADCQHGWEPPNYHPPRGSWLCTGPARTASLYDWRLDREVHAYYVGDVLHQLREKWSSQDVAELVQGMQRAHNYPGGCQPAPRRIVAEVLDGLGVEWEITLPGCSPSKGASAAPSRRPVRSGSAKRARLSLTADVGESHSCCRPAESDAQVFHEHLQEQRCPAASWSLCGRENPACWA
ncbi:hypothetical protein WJX72_004389 [[Myrmecia] bisecta]|uniref:Uncharacterized protein n=1 Tax=[Myrmecia] bisecta TaxID=41462 RepID=A0AAW1Q619_9CHLO